MKKKFSNKTIVALIGLIVIGLVSCFVTPNALWAIILLTFILDEIDN